MCGPIRMRSRIRVPPSDEAGRAIRSAVDAARVFDARVVSCYWRGCAIGAAGSRRPKPSTPTRRSTRTTTRRLDAVRRRPDASRSARSPCRSTTPTPRRERSTLQHRPPPGASRDERIGTLLVNPGGPGFGGTDFAVLAEPNFGDELLDRFDIVAWDPRGTAASTPAIDCTDDYDHFFAAPTSRPTTPAERQQLVDLAKEFDRRLRRPKNAAILPARRHEQLGARHGRHPAGARRGQRSATSGSATAASSAQRGRRCSRRRCVPRCSTARWTRRRRRRERASSRSRASRTR